ncbi:helix-turn-helix domain-containing protein [Krasilnikovia sp. MM14-A1004]|uniref:helix-turn-helix domain-containing protein n=1 Tax=Krasilnikovia sp. MM14-A1004 TaxID=3373541 RepID=UPI00399CAE07
MPSAAAHGTRLARRLRELRVTGWPGGSLTQPMLGRALGVSVPLISSWEKGRSVPPVPRLEAYARLFATARTTADGRPRTPPADRLSDGEQDTYRLLLTQLMDLRAAAEHTSGSGPARSPLQFPTGQAITIVSSELSGPARQRLPYSDPIDPDFVKAYQYADLDSLIELYGYVKGANPANPVHIGVPSKLTLEHRNAHLIVLGGIDYNPVTADILKDLIEVPVAQRERATDADAGAFTVRTGTHRREFRPQIVERAGHRVLKEDVALFLRTPNPYNRERTATLCNGMFSRGTFGVVRALTDSFIQNRNNEFLAERFQEHETYSILCRVKVVAHEIVVPDWTVDDIRLHEWPEAGG